MDLFNKTLNLVTPPIGFLLLAFFYPFYVVAKALSYIKRCQSEENVAGKVVLITGASSGIGEHLAYEYASRGARLALVARRVDRLHVVAKKSRALGSPEVIEIRADVSKGEDCKRLVQEASTHFGQLDHLVNNAGTVQICLLESYADISDASTVMDTNFWGAVRTTHHALPFLRRNRGKLVAIASPGGWATQSMFTIYGASKAAMINFFNGLRAEVGSEMGITVVTPGLIQSDLATPENLEKAGIQVLKAEPASACAKAIVDAVCRGQRYLTEPSWVAIFYWLHVFIPEATEWMHKTS